MAETAARFSFGGLERIEVEAEEPYTSLHAAGNRIRSLEWLNVSAFAELKQLDLRHNQLAACSGVECCPLLVEIDLRDNRLPSGSRLAKELLPLRLLERCDARHNPFSESFSSVHAMVASACPEAAGPGDVPRARGAWRQAMVRALPRLVALDGLSCDPERKELLRGSPAEAELLLPARRAEPPPAGSPPTATSPPTVGSPPARRPAEPPRSPSTGLRSPAPASPSRASPPRSARRVGGRLVDLSPPGLAPLLGLQKALASPVRPPRFLLPERQREPPLRSPVLKPSLLPQPITCSDEPALPYDPITLPYGAYGAHARPAAAPAAAPPAAAPSATAPSAAARPFTSPSTCLEI